MRVQDDHRCQVRARAPSRCPRADHYSTAGTRPCPLAGQQRHVDAPVPEGGGPRGGSGRCGHHDQDRTMCGRRHDHLRRAVVRRQAEQVRAWAPRLLDEGGRAATRCSRASIGGRATSGRAILGRVGARWRVRPKSPGTRQALDRHLRGRRDQQRPAPGGPPPRRPGRQVDQVRLWSPTCHLGQWPQRDALDRASPGRPPPTPGLCGPGAGPLRRSPLSPPRLSAGGTS